MGVLLGFYENTRAMGSGNPEQDTMLKKAYDLIDVLQPTHPESGKPNTIRGDFYLRDGRLGDARDQFREAVKHEQDKFPIWQQLVQHNFQLRDYPGTHEHAAKAIELFPTVPWFYLIDGVALNNLKRRGGDDAGRGPLLRRLRDNGGCTPAKSAALATWAGCSRDSDPSGAVGPRIWRWLDAKLCLFQGRVTTAKAYLGFAPVTSIF